MVKLISALAVAGVVALGSTGASARTLRSKSGGEPVGGPLGKVALLALETPSNDGCTKFESAGVKQNVPFLREQCLDEHGLTYFTRNEMNLADSIKHAQTEQYEVLSREALVNHRLNQVDSCRQLLRTGRHMRSVYKANERDILMARAEHRYEIDPRGEDTEDTEEIDDQDAIDDEKFKDLLAAFKGDQLRPYVAPMSSIADKCMNDLLKDQGCNDSKTRTFLKTYGPGFKDDVEVYITSTKQGTKLRDVLHALSLTSNAICRPKPPRGSF